MRIPTLGLAILLSACAEAVPVAEADSPDGVRSVTQDGISSDVPDHHARIIGLVEAGDIALRDQDSDALFQASERLTALGAAPLGGAEDLARRWKLDAIDMTPEGQRESIPYRGRIQGPAYRRQTLAPGEQDVIEDVFYAAEPAEMTLKAMGDVSLRWEISEDDPESEAPVCVVESVTDEPQSCRFLPLWTSKYRILISNPSDQDSTYLFVTN